MGIESKIQNSHLLMDVFSQFPSFHDAEVHRIILDRRSNSLPDMQASIHVFEMTPEVGPRGNYVLKNHSLVSIRFSGVADLELEGFNHQNVLGGLSITDLSQQQLGEERFHVAFQAIFGVSSEFSCDSISIESCAPYASDER